MIINASIELMQQLPALLEIPEIRGIYLSLETCGSKEAAACRGAGKKVYFALPYIGTPEKSRLKACEGSCDGFLVRTLDQLALLKSLEYEGEIVADQGLYAWNTQAIAQLRDFGAKVFTAPFELTRQELYAVFSQEILPVEAVIYGYYPVMISNQCLRLTTGGCAKKEAPYSIFYMTDRTGEKFRAVNHCEGCYNVIYNTVPTVLFDMEPRPERVRLMFTVEDGKPAGRLARAFISGDSRPLEKYTRGHYRRETL